MTNADNFSKQNLNLYMDKLTPSELKELKEKQIRIRQHGYSEIDSENEYIVQTAKKFGWWQEEPMTNILQSLINTDEARYGKQTPKESLDNQVKKYSELLSVKGTKTEQSAYDILKQNMNKEFLQKVWNGRQAYENKHGEMTPEQYRSMINGIANQTRQKEIQGTYDITKKQLNSKVKESTSLVNFRNSAIPQIESKIGHKLNITSTVRQPNGKYTSWHEKGLAMDIGYTLSDGRQMSAQQRLTLVGETLARPDVKMIAVSSADKYGQAIINTYGKTFASKIQDTNKKGSDGKTVDQRLGTNHTTHLHITFNNTANSTKRILVSDSQGNKYTIPENQVNVALKQGYKRI